MELAKLLLLLFLLKAEVGATEVKPTASQQRQTACDLLFTASDNLASYCQCRDVLEASQSDGSEHLSDSKSLEISQLSCAPQSFAQIRRDLAEGLNLDDSLRVQIDYLTIQTNLSESKPTSQLDDAHHQLLIDHMSLQLSKAGVGPDIASEQSQSLEEQMIDFGRLINETHLQFMSIFLLPDAAQASKNGKHSDKSEGDKARLLPSARSSGSAKLAGGPSELKFARLLAKFDALTRLEVSGIGAGSKKQRQGGTKGGQLLLLDEDTFRFQTRLKWLSLASNGQVSFGLRPAENGNEKGVGWRSPFAPLASNLEYLSLESSNLEKFPLFSLLASPYRLNNDAPNQHHFQRQYKYTGFPNLTYLSLAGNKLASFEEDFFVQFAHENESQLTLCHELSGLGKQEKNLKVFLLPSLTQLDLSSNKLNGLTFKVGQYILCTMPNLSQLYLQRNKIIQVNLNSLLSAPFNTWPESVYTPSYYNTPKSSSSEFHLGDEMTPNNHNNASRVLTSRLEYVDLSSNNLLRITAIQPAESITKTFHARIKSIDLAHNKLRRPILTLDSKLINRIIFKESFELIGSEAQGLDYSDGLGSNITTRREIGLDELDSSFVIYSNSSWTTLCDFLSPPTNANKQLNQVNSNELLNEVILTNNELHWIASRDFSSLQCKDIQTLRLSRNLITFIENDALNWLHSLEQLDLSYNSIISLEENIFYKNVKLRILNLSGNRIRLLDRNIFSHLLDLEELILDGNELYGVPSELLANNQRLEVVDFSKNKITHLDKSVFANLHQLRVLNLRENSLKRFTQQLFELAVGVYSTYSETVTNKSYKHAKIRSSSGSSPSKSVFKTAQNKSTKKRHGRQVTEGANNLLVLSFNQMDLFQYDNCTNFSQSVELLRINNNRLKELTISTFKCLRSVRRLHLHSNRLRQLDCNLFNQLNQLEFIDLSNNQLSHIQPGTFAHSNFLHQVNLSKNQIVKIHLLDVFTSNQALQHTPRDLTQVESLDLSDNQNLSVEDSDLMDFFIKISPHRFNLANIKQITSNKTETFPKLQDRLYLESLNLSSIQRIEATLYDTLADSLLAIEKLDLSFVKLSIEDTKRLFPFLRNRCQNDLSELNLSGNSFMNEHLTKLLSSLSDNLQLNFLNLSLNALEHWPFNAKTSTKLARIQKLDLCKNRLRYFIENNLSSYEFPRIESLNLSSNSLIGLIESPSLRLKSLSSLMPQIKYLDLSHNRLTWIPAEFFEDLKELAWLRIDHNQLETFPSSFPNEGLVLDLSFNLKLRNFHPVSERQHLYDFATDIELNELITFEDYSSNNIPHVKCQSINQYLVSLRDNMIEGFQSKTPDNLLAVQSEREERDKVEDERCEHLVSIVGIVTLDSTSCNLDLGLVSEIRQLLHLNLRGNEITQLEISSKNEQVIYLDLSHNKIENLPDALHEKLPNLKRLDLSHNQLREYPTSVILSSTNLMYLDLSFNRIDLTSFNHDTKLISSLVILKLDHNILTDIKALNIAAMKSLRFIDLRFNQLKSDQVIPLLSRPSLFTLLSDYKMSQDSSFYNNRPALKVNENSLLIDWTADQSKRGKYSMNIHHVESNDSFTTVHTSESIHQIKFCTLVARNPAQICLRTSIKDQMDECFYLKKPPNISACLTNLAEPNKIVSSNYSMATTGDSSKLISLSLDKQVKTNSTYEEDYILRFIDFLKKNWLQLKELNLNDHLTSIGNIRADSVWANIDGKHPIYTITVIKLAIVAGSICIVSLLIAIFTLLTCLSNNREYSSPKSEITNVTSEIEETSGSSSMHNKSSMSENSSQGMLQSSLPSAGPSTSCNRSTSNSSKNDAQQQTVVERISQRRGILQLDANQLINQQVACSTPSSSLAPSSVETAETLQAIDSIQSGTSAAQYSVGRPKDSVDQYEENFHADLTQQNYQPHVATVLRMVKSSSVNFDPNKQQRQIGNQLYGTLNSRKSNSNLRSKIRAVHNHQQYRHRECPIMAGHHSTSGLLHNSKPTHSNQQPFTPAGYETSDVPDITLVSQVDTQTAQQQNDSSLDPITMSLLSINTVLSHNFRSSASQQVSPASTSGPGDDQAHNLCQYHRLIQNANGDLFSSGAILEQEEEQLRSGLLPISNLPPPPASRAIHALESPIQFKPNSVTGDSTMDLAS